MSSSLCSVRTVDEAVNIQIRIERRATRNHGGSLYVVEQPRTNRIEGRTALGFDGERDYSVTNCIVVTRA